MAKIKSEDEFIQSWKRLAQLLCVAALDHDCPFDLQPIFDFLRGRSVIEESQWKNLTRYYGIQKQIVQSSVDYTFEPKEVESIFIGGSGSSGSIK